MRIRGEEIERRMRFAADWMKALYQTDRTICARIATIHGFMIGRIA